MKKFYQCPGCGAVMNKSETSLAMAQSGIMISGGRTCTDCNTCNASSGNGISK